MTSARRANRFFRLLVLALVSATGCCHQSFRGALNGTVVDRAQRPVPGAQVVVCTSNGGESLFSCPRRADAYTGADGRFSLPPLAPEPCPPGDVISVQETSITVCASDADGNFVWAPTTMIHGDRSADQRIEVGPAEKRSSQRACDEPGDPRHRTPLASDRDGDRIPDSVDLCPDDSEDYDGYEDDDGCPDSDCDDCCSSIIYRRIGFHAGQSAIAERARPVLDHVAAELRDRAEIVRVEIRGTATRAAAVHDYLLANGVPAAKLVTAEAAGPFVQFRILQSTCVPGG